MALRWLALIVLVACDSYDAGIEIDRVVPSSGPSNLAVDIRIEGHFARPIRSSIDDNTSWVADVSLTLDDIEIAQPTWRDESVVEASVPAGLVPGSYDVNVQVGTSTVTIPDGYTVLSPGAAATNIFATTTTGELWEVDPTTMQAQRIGTIEDPTSASLLSVDALAVDVDGNLIGITAPPCFLVRIAATDATLLSKVAVSADHDFWGATMAPAGAFGPEAALVVAANDTASLYTVDKTGVLTNLGPFGNGLAVAGDVSYMPGDGLYATVRGGACAGTCIAKVATNGEATLVGTTGPGDLWALGRFGGELYALAGSSDVYRVDTTTGDTQQVFATTIGSSLSDAAP